MEDGIEGNGEALLTFMCERARRNNRSLVVSEREK
tara:strand:- start:1916 stop:2020 length:105 start_codon:yes stop_codon:yes gene_type:complete